VAGKSDGTVYAWGLNAAGQLGDGSNASSSAPVRSFGLVGVTFVSAGRSHTAVQKSDGSVWCFGDNTYGQLGVSGLAFSILPVQVSGLP